MQQNSYIIEGFRIPTGKQNGIYKNIIPEVFTAHLLKKFREKYPFLNSELDELILGVALGTGGNMARYALLEAGFNENITATTIDFQCGSSLKAVLNADAQIKSNQSECILVGGMESNTLAPQRKYNQRDFRFENNSSFYKNATFAPPIFGESDLILAAKNVALEYNISKIDMQKWLVRSHEKAQIASEKGFFDEIILPFKSHFIDQTIKKNLKLESIISSQTSELIDATTTAHLHDGATVLLMVNKDFCHKNNLKPKFEIIAQATTGCLPSYAPEAVIYATQKLLLKFNFPMEKIDLFEINESFALKPLIFKQKFKISDEKINIFGGNLAFGHPFGASGAMNLLHLMTALEKTSKEYGMVSMAVAGGQGISVLIKRCTD